jgi:peptidoglycan-N-acetylglucosamine deacetylase
MLARDSGKIFVLTFDLEEWYHILDLDCVTDHRKWDALEVRIFDNAYKILNLLDDHKIKATFFVLGWIAKKHPDLIKYISDRGHEIGSHSQNHLLIYNADRELFRRDIIESLDLIQSIINRKVTAFRAPGFSIKDDTLWAFKIMGEAGISLDSSIFPARRGHGGMKNFHLDQPFLLKAGQTIIKEFPINMYKLGRFRIPFSGGGYFRVMPFNLFKYFADKSQYMMTYFHPRDFDPGQPTIEELPLVRKFKCYYGLSAAFGKLERLLDTYRFMTLSSAADNINWNEVPLIDSDN